VLTFWDGNVGWQHFMEDDRAFAVDVLNASLALMSILIAVVAIVLTVCGDLKPSPNLHSL
jgi:hypothetical protein